jgi:hypothetical protein
MAARKQPPKVAADKAAADASAAAKTTTDELECEVLEPLLHNGDKYMPGDFIYLTETELAAKQAAGLARFGTPVNDGDLA